MAGGDELLPVGQKGNYKKYIETATTSVVAEQVTAWLQASTSVIGLMGASTAVIGHVIADASTAITGYIKVDQTTPGVSNAVTVTSTAGTVLFSTSAPAAVTIITLPAANLDTNAVKASLYGKNAAAGDDPIKTDGSGNMRVALATYSGSAVDRWLAIADGVAGDSYNNLPVSNMPHVYNGATWDRLRSIAASGAGLGVQKVGTLGELITLAASAARTESANGTAVTGLGWRNRYIVLFDLTVADTDAGDTLDVYVDVSLDGSTWLNAVHFTQIVGTDAASKRYAVLDPSAPGTAEILVTADAAAGAVRPSMFGPQMRARWAITDAGADDASFTFSVVAYAI